MALFPDAFAWIGLVLSLGASIYCWRRIWRSDDHWFFKISLIVVSGIPFWGPLIYAFLEIGSIKPEAPSTPRRPQQGSRLLRHWNANEHVYLSWAALIFVLLGVLVWWLHGWSPGNLYATFLGTVTTDVANTHYVLLIIAVLVFGYIDHKRKFYKRMREEPHPPVDPPAQAEHGVRPGLFRGKRKRGMRGR